MKASQELMAFGPEDRVLDIGCGSGYIAALLAPRVQEYWGLDTSPRFISQCRARLVDEPKATFEVLPHDDYFDFSQAPKGHFNKVICVGVVPLYPKVEDVGRLMETVREMITPEARMIITDFVLNGSILKDVWGSIMGGIKYECLGEKLKLLWGASTTEYLKQRRLEKILSFTKNELEYALSGYGVAGRLIKGQLGMNTQRWHIFYQF
ncbi:MAG: class I SAM-dependent methyltransferase [Acidobacteriaceae bacterium]|nr:class I SAM-dependent methyltransferase [Acidobacteriaceae bacterium]